MGGDFVHVPFDNPGRNTDEFRISAIVEQQVVAKIFESPFAIKAFQAGGRVGSDNSLADAKPGDAFTDGDYIPGEFMSKERGRDDHTGVVTSAKHLNIGTTGKGSLYPY